MNAELRIVAGAVATIVLVMVVLSAGWFLWGRSLWAPGIMGVPEEYVRESSISPWQTEAKRTRGCESPWQTRAGYTSLSDQGLTIAQAQEAVEAYIETLGDANLEIAEVIEFEHSFYITVCEHDTGIGAMQLLVDKPSGAVGPEMGPNMLWNVRYGIHRHGRRTMAPASDMNTLSEAQAIEVAQRWLDANQPGVAAQEQANPFYGYYTVRTVRDNRIEGILSVHSTTGQVWYHTWHGDFVRMIEGEQGHD